MTIHKAYSDAGSIAHCKHLAWLIRFSPALAVFWDPCLSLFRFWTFLLVLGAGPAISAPPVGCVEDVAGNRLCDAPAKPIRSEIGQPVYSTPHPATLPGPWPTYQPVGQVVASVAPDVLARERPGALFLWRGVLYRRDTGAPWR